MSTNSNPNQLFRGYAMTITLQVETLTVTAEVNGDRAEITRVTDAAGHPVNVTSQDLDRIESAIFSETQTDLGGTGTFTVKHHNDRIFSIADPDGYTVPHHAPLFTEVAECFHIDRRWAMLEDSDVQGHARRCYC